MGYTWVMVDVQIVWPNIWLMPGQEVTLEVMPQVAVRPSRFTVSVERARLTLEDVQRYAAREHAQQLRRLQETKRALMEEFESYLHDPDAADASVCDEDRDQESKSLPQRLIDVARRLVATEREGPSRGIPWSQNAPDGVAVHRDEEARRALVVESFRIGADDAFQCLPQNAAELAHVCERSVHVGQVGVPWTLALRNRGSFPIRAMLTTIGCREPF